MPYPFEVPPDALSHRLDEMVAITVAGLQSQFLVLPKSRGFVDYARFQTAYEVLKRHTHTFTAVAPQPIWDALREDSLCLIVLRTILGMTPPEWAELARVEQSVAIDSNAARALEGRCRSQPRYCAGLDPVRNTRAVERINGLIAVAVTHLRQGAAGGSPAVVHRLDKVDTTAGLTSLQQVAGLHVPYAMLLYERLLGRPFASYRDAASELVGDVMELAIEERLQAARISYRKTRRAEKIAGFDKAPDFFVPDEYAPAVIIEAKIASDDGTARDKADRIQTLAEMRDKRVRDGLPAFELVACIDGRGFGVRRADMRRIVLNTKGKVFSLSTLDSLISNTRLREFVAL